MKNVMKRWGAAVGAAAVALSGVAIASAPAHADGANGEVRGFLWGDTGNANWEGTYRMPGGVEAWCASVWQPEPMHATAWSDPQRLTYNDGSYFGDTEMSRLAYVVSEATHSVIAQSGVQADTVAAATSIIIHDQTFKQPVPANGNQPYEAAWALAQFGAGVDPEHTGQNPTGVPGAYDTLLAEAELYHGAWSLDLSAGDTSTVLLGDTVTVTGHLAARGSVPVPFKEIPLQIIGAQGPTTITTDADGDFTFDIVTTAQEVSVLAERSAPADRVTMRVPTEWRSDQKPQNMIEVSESRVTAEVAFTANQISIGTSATDQADGDRLLPWNGGTIVDSVTYEHLTPGTQYTVSGELMDARTGNTTGITGETTFTPDTPSGTIPVTFTVPEGHAGRTLVAFERLYNIDGILQATHEDLEDEAQTVTVAEEPAGPTEKPQPRAPGLAQTGSPTQFPFIWSALALTAVGVATLSGAARRNTR